MCERWCASSFTVSSVEVVAVSSLLVYMKEEMPLTASGDTIIWDCFGVVLVMTAIF